MQRNTIDTQAQANKELARQDKMNLCVEIMGCLSAVDPATQNTMRHMFQVFKYYTMYIALQLDYNVDQEIKLIKLKYKGKPLSYANMYQHWIDQFFTAPFQIKEYTEVMSAGIAIQKTLKDLYYAPINEDPEGLNFITRVNSYVQEARIQEKNKPVKVLKEAKLGITNKILNYSKDVNQTNEKTTILHISEQILRYVLNELQIQMLESQELSTEYSTYITDSVTTIITSRLICHNSKPSVFKINEQGNTYDIAASLIIEHLFRALPLLKPEKFAELCENIKESLISVQLINENSDVTKGILHSLRLKLEEFKIDYPKLYEKIAIYNETPTDFDKNALLVRKKAQNKCVNIIPNICTHLLNEHKNLLTIIESFIKLNHEANEAIQQIRKNSGKLQADKLRTSLYISTNKYTHSIFHCLFNQAERFPLDFSPISIQVFSTNMVSHFKKMIQDMESISNEYSTHFKYCQALEVFLINNTFNLVMTPDCFQEVIFFVSNKKIELYLKSEIQIAEKDIYEQYVCNAELCQDSKNISTQGIYLLDAICKLVDLSEKENSEIAKKYLARGLKLLPNNKTFTLKSETLEYTIIKNEASNPTNYEAAETQLKINLPEIDALPASPKNNSNLEAEFKKIATKQAELEKQRKSIEQDKQNILKSIEEYKKSISLLSSLCDCTESGLPKNINSIKAKYKQLMLLKEKIATAQKNIQDRIKKFNTNKEAFEKMYNAYTQSTSNTQNVVQRKPVQAPAQKKSTQAAVIKKQEKNQRRLDNKAKRAADLNDPNLNKLANKVPQDFLENKNKKPVINDTAMSPKIPAMDADIVLSRFDFLKKFDAKLRKHDCKLVFTGSITNVLGIICFNENPNQANNFPVNDIDIKIILGKNADQLLIRKIISEFGFQMDFKDCVPGCSKYTKLHNGQDFDLSYVYSEEYRASPEYIFWRMAQAEFVNSETSISKNSANVFVVGFENHQFQLTCAYPNEYKLACQFKELRMLNPQPKSKAYVYSCYKYAAKLFDCGVNLNESNIGNAIPGSVHYQQLPWIIPQYFATQSSRNFYQELKVFMIKGVSESTTHLAIPLISAFYSSYLLKNYGYSLPQDVFKKCVEYATSYFLRAYCLHAGKDIKPSLTEVEKCFTNFIEMALNECNVPSNFTRNPTIFFYNNPQMQPQLQQQTPSAPINNNGTKK